MDAQNLEYPLIVLTTEPSLALGDSFICTKLVFMGSLTGWLR